MKGLAHVGAWRAIRESGLSVAGIIGTSTGAMIGAAIAAGRSIEEIEANARSLRRRDVIRLRRRAIWLNGIRAPSVFRGDVLRAYVDRFLRNKSWGDLAIPLLVNAVDLATGEMLWEKELPSGVSAAPMTYEHEGRQFIVMAISEQGNENELIAFALPAA